MTRFFVSFFTIAVLFWAPAAQAKFKAPWLSGPIIDEAGILSSERRDEIERLLRDLNQRDIAQVQVYITKSLQGLPIEQASIDIVDEWKLGTAKKDNGLLFLIAPNERKIRIEVGQGLEGVMPDVYTKRINDDVVIPYFRKGDMSEGIYQGVKAIISVLDGEELQSKAQPKVSSEDHGFALPYWAIILIWIFIIFFGRMGGGRRGGGGGLWMGGGGFGGGGFGGGGGGWSGGGGGFSGGGSSSSW